MTEAKVSHIGCVIGADRNIAKVRIEVKSACAECHAKSLCSASDLAEKIIETTCEEPVEIGDKVIVEMAEKSAFQAVFVVFFIPFVMMVAALFAAFSLSGSEVVAAIASIAVLPPYFLALTLFRTYYKKKFVFTCRKL